MSEEQRQRQMDFILEQQALLTATVSKLSDKVDRTADSITALLAIAEIQSGEIKELGESVRAINERQREAGERQREADERQREAEERQREGDERLNALINTVERFIEGRTGQEGDKG